MNLSVWPNSANIRLKFKYCYRYSDTIFDAEIYQREDNFSSDL